jgi:hypothetical protein
MVAFYYQKLQNKWTTKCLFVNFNFLTPSVFGNFPIKILSLWEVKKNLGKEGRVERFPLFV